MNNIEVLNKLYQNKISIKKAYKLLYKERKAKRSHFVKLRIYIPEEKRVTRFVNFLFLLPIPLFIIKFFLRRSQRYVSDSIKIPIKDIVDVFGIKGAVIDVLADDNTKVLIKTI